MKTFFSAKRLCRAGVIAALYVALTYAFGALSQQGFLQIRPAEALCLLPLFFVEAIPALWIGCMISNLTSPFLLYDVFIGSATTLAAAILTYLIGKICRKNFTKITFGGLFPVLLNALVIPVIIVFLCGDLSYGTRAATYFTFALSLFVTQSVWVYALGTPLVLFLSKMQKRGVKTFL